MKIKVICRNVGQGNCNEIYYNDKLIIVYDIGTSIYATKEQVNDFIKNLFPLYDKDKPILILSHWDLDHYHILKGMLGQNKYPFSAFFYIGGKLPNSTSEYIISCFDNVQSIVKYPITRKENKKICPELSVECLFPQAIQDLGIKLFAPNVINTRNNSELVCTIKKSERLFIFPGDSLYEQLAKIINGEDISMVVPHHGGDAGPMETFPVDKVKKAVFSYGKNNRYNHPFATIKNSFCNANTYITTNNDVHLTF